MFHGASVGNTANVQDLSSSMHVCVVARFCYDFARFVAEVRHT